MYEFSDRSAVFERMEFFLKHVASVTRDGDSHCVPIEEAKDDTDESISLELRVRAGGVVCLHRKAHQRICGVEKAHVRCTIFGWKQGRKDERDSQKYPKPHCGEPGLERAFEVGLLVTE